MPFVEGALVAGKLRILRVLGQGAMGTVYEAFDEGLGRSVALKVVSPELAHDHVLRTRFERESRAAAGLRSEHTVRIHEVGTTAEGEPFLVMERLHGTTLEAYLEIHGALRVADAVRHVLEALDAIAEAHGRGLVHRDLKPGNLFLATVGSRTLVKVLDFGLVKDLDPSTTLLTESHTSMGTPAYMAPEQIRMTSAVDARADVWSMGVVLYELITGALPWNAGSIAALLTCILSDPPAPILERRPALAPEIAAVVMRCLAREPAERFASAKELRRALADATMTARPVRARSSNRWLLFLVPALSVLVTGAVVLQPVLRRRRSDIVVPVASVVAAPPPSIAPEPLPPATASASAERPASSAIGRRPTVRTAGTRAVVKITSGLDDARGQAWLKRVQPAFDLCSDLLPCSDVSVLVYEDDTIDTTEWARIKSSCNAGSKAGGCVARAVRASFPVPRACEDAGESPCRVRFDVKFF